MNDYNTYSIGMYMAFTVIGTAIGYILWWSILPVIAIFLLLLWAASENEKREGK